MWKHLRDVNTGTKPSANNLPTELIINGERINNSEQIAAKLNNYFSTVGEQFEDNSDITHINTDKIKHFVNSKVPSTSVSRFLL